MQVFGVMPLVPFISNDKGYEQTPNRQGESDSSTYLTDSMHTFRVAYKGKVVGAEKVNEQDLKPGDYFTRIEFNDIGYGIFDFVHILSSWHEIGGGKKTWSAKSQCQFDPVIVRCDQSNIIVIRNLQEIISYGGTWHRRQMKGTI